MKRFFKGFVIAYLACFVFAIPVCLGLTFLKKFEPGLGFWDVVGISNTVGVFFGLLGGLANILEIKILKQEEKP